MDKNQAVRAEFLDKSFIERGLRYAVATGNWGDKGQEGIRKGVSQALQRLTFASTVSHLRRIDSGVDRTTKQARGGGLSGGAGRRSSLLLHPDVP